MPMDDARYGAFQTFLTLHHTKARPVPGRRVAHIQFHSSCTRDAPLLLMEVYDLIGDAENGDVEAPLDHTSPLVQGLLNQLRTYDTDHQRIVGLIFDRQTVYSHVLERPA